ncbi:acyltransferase family protein [Ochrobactrum teleogrylli]|uniref:acyltransferase family protein n=1 Tax=Ochrobactrum teleogrylli TaxID=2479765 RepID=UPI00384DD3FE
MNRLPDFDGLRFLLCAGIAFFHFSFQFTIDNEKINSIILTFAYFTDVFFILSGLFLALRSSYGWNLARYTSFIGKRLARIYPLHVVAFSCFALISVLAAAGLFHPSTPPNMSWRDGLAQLLLVHSWGMGQSLSYNYVSWSLSALFLMYLCFPLFDWFCKRLGSGVLVVVAIALLGGEYLARSVGTPSLTRIQFADIGVFRALPSFLFGMWLARRKHTDLPKPLIMLALAGCLVVFLFYHPQSAMDGVQTLEGPWRLVFLYFCTYILYAASMQNIYTPLRWNGFVKLSRYSFGIFILHPLVGQFFFKIAFAILPAEAAQSGFSALLLISGCTLISVLVAIAAWHLFENPIHRWAVRRIDLWMDRLGESAPMMRRRDA